MTDLPERLCNCGTCSQAVEIVIALMKKSLENDCPLWNYQIGFIQMMISRLLLEFDRDKLSFEDVEEANKLTTMMQDTLMQAIFGHDKLIADLIKTRHLGNRAKQSQ